jgi:hypothetical protein
MNFYNQVINEKKELEYFLYLIEHLNMLELEYKELMNDRDFKLKLLLIEDFDDVNKYFVSCFEEYKNEINKLALNRLVVKELEDLGSRIDTFIKEMNVVFHQVELPKIK